MRSRYGVDLSTSQPESFFGRTNIAELPNLQLFFCANAAPVSVTIDSSKAAHLHLCLSGRGALSFERRRVEIGEGEASSVRPPVLLRSTSPPATRS